MKPSMSVHRAISNRRLSRPTTFRSHSAGSRRTNDSRRQIREEALQKLARDWRDQFGPHPVAIRNLLTLNEIKLVAARAKVGAIEVKDCKVMLTRGGDYLLIGDRFPRLTSGEGENSLGELASYS